ncbi:Zinc finger protein 536-like 1 [Homarus americanus]|uniref:Zinc finger protein 536-like 1 n=1 Tax=Homarus americanus TaxID=6706 RepID=A0A8J5NB93_HOMAM|nr:Zinc finger protein 536-like 1 [Homarus americanus]
MRDDPKISILQYTVQANLDQGTLIPFHLPVDDAEGVGGDGEDNLDSHRPWLSSRSGETRIHSVGRANSVCGALNLEKQNLLLAIHAVAGGLMTGRQAAKAFSVPRTTLRRWMTQNRRLYPCPHCSYRATERSHLKKHLASRHRDLDNLIPTGWEHVRPGALIPVVELRQPVAASTPTSLASRINGNSSMGAATPVGPSSGAFTPYSASTTPRGSTPDLGQVAPTDKQSFMCPVCGKQFGQPYNLRRHLTTHTGERPYRCPHCNYAASQNVHLEKHIRRIHLNNGQNPTSHSVGPVHTWTVEPMALTP